MQKSCGTFCVFVQKMGKDILVLLSLLNGKTKTPAGIRMLLFVGLLSLQRLEVTIDTHQACASSNILAIVKSFDQIHESLFRGLRAYIQKNTVLGFDVSTESFKEEKM